MDRTGRSRALTPLIGVGLAIIVTGSLVTMGLMARGLSLEGPLGSPVLPRAGAQSSPDPLTIGGEPGAEAPTSSDSEPEGAPDAGGTIDVVAGERVEAVADSPEPERERPGATPGTGPDESEPEGVTGPDTETPGTEGPQPEETPDTPSGDGRNRDPQTSVNPDVDVDDDKHGPKDKSDHGPQGNAYGHNKENAHDHSNNGRALGHDKNHGNGKAKGHSKTRD